MISTFIDISFLLLPLLIGPIILRRGLRLPDRRIGLEVPTQSLLMITFIGFGTYLMTISIYMSLTGSHATTQGQVQLPQKEQYLLDGIAKSLAFAAIVIAHHVYRTNGPTRLGFAPRQIIPAIPNAVVGALFVLPMMFWITWGTMWLWDRIHFQHDMQHEMLKFLDATHESASKVLIIISAGVIAPLVEELLFRGHVQTMIRQATRRAWLAILITSILFALVHPVWTQPPIFFLAICLGYIYERTGNLWTSILLHAAFNGVNIFNSLYFKS